MTVTIHSDILYSSIVNLRITELKAVRKLPEDAENELIGLINFRDEVTGELGIVNWELGVSFISSRYWDTFADSNAEDLYGDATKTAYWDSVKYADDLSKEFSSFELDGQEYLTDGKR